MIILIGMFQFFASKKQKLNIKITTISRSQIRYPLKHRLVKTFLSHFSKYWKSEKKKNQWWCNLRISFKINRLIKYEVDNWKLCIAKHAFFSQNKSHHVMFAEHLSSREGPCWSQLLCRAFMREGGRVNVPCFNIYTCSETKSQHIKGWIPRKHWILFCNGITYQFHILQVCEFH